jgi:hypothetical protein
MDVDWKAMIRTADTVRKPGNKRLVMTVSSASARLERGKQNASQVTYSNGLTWPPGYTYQPLRCKCDVTDGGDAPVSRLVSLGVTSTLPSAA